MPKLLAPDDLLAIVTPLWQRLAPSWAVEVRRVPRASIGSDGRTVANATTSEALIRIADDLAGDALRKTLGHEMAHVNAWPITEILDHGDPRTLALIEPMIERFGVAAVGLDRKPLSAGLARSSLPSASGLAREGCSSMDLPIIIAALSAIATAADPAASLTEFIAQLKTIEPGAAPPSAEDMAGGPVEMMRRALARKTTVDVIGEKLRAIYAAKTDGEALALARADKLDAERLRLEITEKTAAGLVAERKQLLVDAVRKTGLARSAFLAEDGSPADGYRDADMTIEGLRSFVARLGGPVARVAASVVAAAKDDDEAGLARRAEKSGMTVEDRRRAEANVNRGLAAQEV